MHAISATRVRSLASFATPGLAVGLALFTVLLIHHGREVASALAVAGSGLLVVALFHLVPLCCDAFGWRALIADPERPARRTMVWARWIGESVNGLLPVLGVGGNVVKAQLLARRGVSGSHAGASVVVDVTLLLATQLLLTLLGLALLAVHLGGHALAPAALTGLGLMALALAAFYAVQRHGLFAMLARGVARVARRLETHALTTGASAIDAEVTRLYGNPRALGVAGGWHLLSWLVGAGEVWLALHFLGHPVGWRTALLVESLGQAVRASAFAVPFGLGVQEGGYMLLGRAVGLAPETALALSLSKRVREIVLGLPGLIAWQLESAARLAGVEREGSA